MQHKRAFEMPFAGIDEFQGKAILLGKAGESSVIISIRNPVIQYGADPQPYQGYQQVLLNAIKILGEGYLLQKQDVFSRRAFEPRPASTFLQQKYNEHFSGRISTHINTYLILTRQVKKGAFYVYNEKVLSELVQHADKVLDLFSGAGLRPVLLMEPDIQKYVTRVLAMEFSSGHPVMDNLLCGEQQLGLGSRAVRSISLINTDVIDLPEEIAPYSERQESAALKGFPVDNLFFLHQVPGYHCMIYNQVIEIPSQQLVLTKLEVKRKRHSGVPDPANLVCVQDIDRLMEDVARENQLLVQAHFNILVCADQDKIARACNFVESSLFQQGILPSRQSYNQMELFRTALPGNGVELKVYDWFLTTADAALCFFFKESLQQDEDSEFLIRFTNREGIPIGIDPSDLNSGRLNNRNKLIVGPSGSGKSVCVNAIVEQYLLYNMDVVIVDVGHSYSGLNTYLKARYITYTEERPITMNPFLISQSEYNIEKKDFLITLVSLLWKGTEGQISSVERDVIASVISGYYATYFSGSDPGGEDAFKIAELNFNSFYEYALRRIPQIKEQERIPFDLDEFRFVLKKFYKEGEYEAILNERTDASLFSEPFIVFEIDSVQSNKILFPIITLAIVDLFIQKMRFRTHQRKCLILEECWKAIGSPLMAGFLLYLNKTVRKFWGEVIEVTQSLSDVLGNPILKECIISESDTVILLDQSKFRDNYGEIARLLSLSEAEQKKIFTINKLDNQEGRGRFKEVYIKRGTVGEVYGIELSIYQYLVYTTEKPEKNAVETYARNFGDYSAALNAFVSHLNESGLSLAAFVAEVNRSGIYPFTT
ncbi:TraG family conjugative transposon ATPase [Pedobacter chinensis]|uniref:TraG family conjugative transposon ATPase n=1 Tax=Pedobacter chinensis TaxID=2282421 RepID=A0A369PPW1_9SPHI|nr:TraG family conjugative transposon ATPase [Pedobacter chinensis]RDC54330.1 TraG family conjugative transposon ATPase [Pedobacter chinensis]